MSQKNEISVHLTIVTVDDVQQDSHPPTTNDPKVCDLWSHCNDPLCFSAGCRENVFAIPDKGDQS